MIADSGSVGAISAPASFTALKVVPGGVSGGRLSMIRSVWFTRSRTAAETTAIIAAITTGFRRTISIPVNGHLSRAVPALEGASYLQKVAGPKRRQLRRSYRRSKSRICSRSSSSMSRIISAVGPLRNSSASSRHLASLCSSCCLYRLRPSLYDGRTEIRFSASGELRCWPEEAETGRCLFQLKEAAS